MNDSHPNRAHYLEAVTHAAQYLAAMRAGTEVWVEFGELVRSFFDPDLVAIAGREPEGGVTFRFAALPADAEAPRLLECLRLSGTPVLESGFLSTELMALPGRYAVALLPLAEGKAADTLLVVGHKGDRPLPRHLLEVYLAVTGLMESTLTRLRVEMQLRRMNEELETQVGQRTAALQEAVRELQEINYTISHDLRTPLRAIDGFAMILLKDYGGQLDAEGLRLLHIVRENTRQMGRLIDDLSAWSRAGQVAMAPARVDMGVLAEAVWRERQADLGDRHVEFRLTPLPEAVGDRALLREVFARLLDNALKFTRGKERAVIEVGGRCEESEYTYYVRDNGIGFDMRFAGKLFGVFQRLHPEQPLEGTGIGLAVVKRIIERHGGRVWAEGAPGEGAVFHFALPVKEERHG